MPLIRIKKGQINSIYFITLTVKNWYYIFDRHDRFEILEDCFVWLQKNKGFKIYSFVFMLNHLHFIGEAQDMSSILNSLKRFTASKIKQNLIENEPTIISLFENSGEFHFWQKSNYPKLIESEDFLIQKNNYIIFNPVKKGYVHNPEDWKWSSVSKFPTRIKIADLD